MQATPVPANPHSPSSSGSVLQSGPMSSQDFSHGVGGPGASPNPLVPVRLPIFAPVIIVRTSGQLETLLYFFLLSLVLTSLFFLYVPDRLPLLLAWGFSGILPSALGKRCTRPASFRHRCFESNKTFAGSYNPRLC